METNPTIDHLTRSCTCTGKQCTQCQMTQCLEGFHRWKHAPDGHRSICKACRKAESQFKAKRRKHDREHAAQINEKKRERYHANPEKKRESSRRSRKRHPETVQAYQHTYSRSDRGKLRERIYRERHPEKVQAFHQAWLEQHPEVVREQAKVTSANYKAQQLGIPGRITVEQWREIKLRYQNMCLRCKQREPLIKLTLDHVIPFALRGANEIGNIQPLCEFCNTSKGVKVIDYRISYDKEQNIG